MVRNALVLALVGIAAAGGWAVGQRPCLRVRGEFVTDDVIVRNGQTYVPASAMAQALGLRVREGGAGCDLVGGEDGLNVPMVRDGYRLEVLDVSRTADYRARYGYHDFPVSAGPGKELIVVTLRLTNGTGAGQPIELTNGRDTALSDARYRSYRPLRGANGRVMGGMLSILAGATEDFALKFEVPQGFRPDRLVVSIGNSSFALPTNFRVPLGR